MEKEELKMETFTEVKITPTSVKFQYLAALVVNLLTMGYGVTSGWASPSLLLLKSDETPLPSGRISTEEESWIASIICIGGVVGNSVFGIVSNKFGPKIAMLSLTVPTIIAWFLVLFSQNVYYLYASRALNGCVGGGVFVVVPSYLSEIASDSVRGALGSLVVLTCNIGILLAFVFGTYCDFFFTPKFVIALMILAAVSIWFLPDSPVFLYKQNKILEAEKSIRFYQDLKGGETDYESLQLELNKLKKTCGTAEKSESNSNSFSWSDLLEGPGKNAMIIGIVLALLNQFCGCFAMLQYTGQIFKDAGSEMDPNKSAILVGAIQLVGSYVPTLLCDRTGRKFLFLVSTIGIAMGLSTLGVFSYLKVNNYPVESFSWVPIASFSFVIFIVNWAVFTLPFLVISEIMPEKLKSFGPSLCMIILWSSSFLVTKCLPLMMALLGMHGLMFAFTGVCLGGAAFILVRMPETKGRSYDEIMRLLE